MLKFGTLSSNQFLKIKALVSSQAYQLRNIFNSKHALLAGHSKWANIRHVKAAKDGEKSLLFLKMARQIRLAVHNGGSADVSLNSILKSVVDEALRKNMPMATIQNNIQKYKENKTKLKRYKVDLLYKQKVYATCIIYTENFAGLKMQMATVLRKGGARLLEGSHFFDEIGIVQAIVDKSRLKNVSDLEDMITEDAIKFGAEEVEIIDQDTGLVCFICRPVEIMPLRKNVEAVGYVIDNSDHLYIPTNRVELLPEELIEYGKFVTKLKEIPGVEEVHDNIQEA